MRKELLTEVALATRHQVTVRGSGEPVVVLAHGFGGTARDWDDVAAYLESHCTVVCYAQAGSLDADPGLFSPVRHRSVFGYVDDLIALLTALDLEGVTYVGHSFAGTVGILAACADPGLIDRLVLVNTSARYLADPQTDYDGGFTDDEVRRLRFAINSNPEQWAAQFIRGIVGELDGGATAEAIGAALERQNPEVPASIAAAAFGFDARVYLERCTVETLVLHCAGDPVVPERAYNELVRLLPNATTARLTCSGHFPHRLVPNEVAEQIAAFLRRGPA